MIGNWSKEMVKLAAGLRRGENVLDYLVSLNKKQPIEKMSREETEQLLKALGWEKRMDYELARRKMIWLVRYFG